MREQTIVAWMRKTETEQQEKGRRVGKMWARAGAENGKRPRGERRRDVGNQGEKSHQYGVQDQHLTCQHSLTNTIPSVPGKCFCLLRTNCFRGSTQNISVSQGQKTLIRRL